jgi:hypothetical protein
MNPELEKILMQPIFMTINKNFEAENNKKDESVKEYFEDDFVANKRLNRLFTMKQKEQCWNRATKIDGRHPDRWRFDAAGNPVLKALKGCSGSLCHEYDHIVPYSKGGETTIRNCQVLQSFANRSKGSKTVINQETLRKNSIRVKLSQYEMDLVEEMIYGNVKKL